MFDPGCKKSLLPIYYMLMCNMEWISAYLFKRKIQLVILAYIMWSRCLLLDCHFGDILAYCTES